MTIDLIPDNEEPFAGNAGAVRNFRLRFVEQTADDPYGVVVGAGASGMSAILNLRLKTADPYSANCSSEAVESAGISLASAKEIMAKILIACVSS